ncbi:unnamed protein product [Somion occarium]|uniref:PHD-type domain-containing protein n=1 Tax=Somion occarium TaxID=3059160 RepID=A0ABP1DJA9_9APHY
MANVSPMGPPPSPKEPRRSGRRSLPSTSSSKSPAGSPTSDSAPKSKENNSRPPLTSSNSSGRTKRAKHEDIDDMPEEFPKAVVNGATNGRNKRKGKEKEKGPLTIDIPDDALSSILEPIDGNADPNPQEEEEAGVTRCICDGAGDDETMVECDSCHEWQHCQCMGLTPDTIPEEYFCERCRPELYPDLAKKHAKRVRQSSSTSHHTTTGPSRSSRSHSPTHLLKPPKRRNTMNSRDAAYDESLQAIIEASAAEARAATMSPVVSTHREDANISHVAENDPEDSNTNGRRKRKRSDDDPPSNKRTRSASVVSDRTPAAQHPTRAETPVNGNATRPPASSSAAPKSTVRAKRGGGRKAQVQQEPMLLDGEDGTAGGTASTRRQASGRSRGAGHDSGSRRAQANANTAAGLYASSAAASRAYHNSHAYAVSQQPPLTSWSLPDYLAHLAHILPTDVPRPLEVRGFTIGANGQATVEVTTERGVKVKWPGKRMSVGDMNKRVRAMVEWVGREQASAAERTRRREALEAALKEIQLSAAEQGDQGQDSSRTDAPMVLDGETLTASPDQEKRTPMLTSSNPVADALSTQDGSSTMKMMEELMEELILFQERFGPGAKVKERERRAAVS